MRLLLVITAAIESGTGLGLLVAPAAVARLLLGAGLDTPVAVTVARIAGAAVLALAVACWLSRGNGRALAFAMLFYNVSAAAILFHATVGPGLTGIGLWPAILLHTGMGIWCAAALKSPRRPAHASQRAPSSF
ncbi:MAG: hypothetical protein V4584_03135 [Verrucomicrobiota bacterium]